MSTKIEFVVHDANDLDDIDEYDDAEQCSDPDVAELDGDELDNEDLGDEQDAAIDDNADEIADNSAPAAAASAPVKDSARRRVVKLPAPKRKSNRKSSDKKANKRRPGRPPSAPKKEPVIKHGIQSVPKCEENLVEFIYDQPILIKKISGFFRLLAAENIQILFRPTELIIYTHDYEKKSHVKVTIDATKLNHYYCEAEYDIGLSCEEFERIMRKIDKHYSQIIIIIDRENINKELTVRLENSINIAEIYQIALTGRYDRINSFANAMQFSYANYPIQLTYPSDYFKRLISDLREHDKKISYVQESHDAPLKIECQSQTKKTRTEFVHQDPASLRLVSRVAPGDCFHMAIMLQNLKAISAAQLSDMITIRLDEERMFMTETIMDDATIAVTTLTEIIDERVT